MNNYLDLHFCMFIVSTNKHIAVATLLQTKAYYEN